MSEEQGDDVFSKLDALLRKHHPDAFDEKPPPLSKPQENMSLPESPAIPVLTDEILPPEEVPDIPVLTEIVDTRQLPPLPIELDLIPEPYVPLDQESQLSEEASILLEKLGDVEKSFTEQPPQETSQPEEELIEIPAIEPLTLQPEPEPSLEVEPEPSLEVEPEPELEAEPEAAAKQALEVEPEPLAETTPTEPELLEEPVFAAPPETLAPMAPSPEPVPSEKPAQPLLTPEILEQLLDSLMEQALKKMDRQLQDTLQNRLSSQLTVALDRTLSSMLDQFAMNIEHMVREAVSQELRKQLSDKGNPD